jgi:hypothetical protein
MKFRRKQRLIRGLLLGLAVAAIAAPVAQARVVDFDRPAPQALPTGLDTFTLAGVAEHRGVVVNHQSQVDRVRGIFLSVHTGQPRPDTLPATPVLPNDRVGVREPGDLPPWTVTTPTVKVVPSPHGFSWRDAGVGFGVALGLALLAAAGLLARRTRRTSIPAV